jgi:hypothetical protein
MANPYKTLGIARKPLSCVIYHISSETATNDFINWFKRDVLELSPFFRTTKNPNLKYNLYAGSKWSKRVGLGTDILFA